MPNSEIQDAFNVASKAIRHLEELIRKETGIDSGDLNRDNYDLIKMPQKYIRTREYFSQTFQLKDLIDDINLRDSICYALMQSDLHRYLIYRFNMYGIVQKIFIKTAIINLVSIIEAVLIGTLKKLHGFCIVTGTVCKYNSNCSTYIRSTTHIKSNQVILTYREKIGTTNLDDDIYEIIEKLIGIRNKVHLSIIDVHEFGSKDYSFTNYVNGLKVLRYLRDNLPSLNEKFLRIRLSSCRIVEEMPF